MKFAEAEGLRREANPGLSGKCRVCGAPTIAKCGSVRVWHWAHQSDRTCDHWWEPETKWHRDWKNRFPEHWQEIIQTAADGERHVADVKTAIGLVIEFQHSSIKPNERESREQFHENMVWVVHAWRAKDLSQLQASIGGQLTVLPNFQTFVVRPSKSALFRNWGNSRVPVYFDFGINFPLWRLNSLIRNERAYLSPVSRSLFVDVHLKGLPFETMCTDAIHEADAELIRFAARSGQPDGFHRYLATAERNRRCF
jgi:competence protein CoiA